jgi:hypothetical protein
LRVTKLITPGVAALALAAAPSLVGGSSLLGPTEAAASSGGAGLVSSAPHSTRARPVVAGSRAKIIHGVGYAPMLAPMAVKRAIWAGDRIRKTPYIWGGGHASFHSPGYDCSGSVSYVLHAAGLLSSPLDSSAFMSWGRRGVGRWITVYTNPGHAFVEIAGIRFDTSAEADPNPPPGSGPRWRPLYPNPPGFAARHPARL